MRRYSRVAEKKLTVAGEAVRPVSYATIPVDYVILRRDPGDSGTVYVGGPDGYPLNPGDEVRLDDVVLSDVDIYVPSGVTANIYAIFRNKPMTALEIAGLAPRRGLVAEYLFEPMGRNSDRLIDTSGHGRHASIVGMYWGMDRGGKYYLCNPRFPVRDTAYVDLGVIDLGRGDLAVEELIYIEDWAKTYLHEDTVERHANVLTGYAAPGKAGYLVNKMYYPERSIAIHGRCADDATHTYFTGSARNVPDRTWVHLVFVRRGGKGYAYMNGGLVDERELEKPNAHVMYRLYIGRQIFNGPDFHGRVALLRLYKHGLDDRDAEALCDLAKLLVNV